MVPGARAGGGAGCAPAACVTYHVREKVTGPPGPGHVIAGVGSPDMTRHSRDLVERAAAPCTAGSGWVTGLLAVPSHLGHMVRDGNRRGGSGYGWS